MSVAPRFHDLTVSAVRKSSVDSIAVTFDVPVALAELYRFVPGQYLTLRAEVEGEDVRRSYSICSESSPAERELSQGDSVSAGLQRSTVEVGIKQVENGVFSTFAQALSVGDCLKVMTPQGNFRAPVGGVHHYLLLAAGSGITPCLSIAKSVLAQEENSQVTLLYGNRAFSSIMFREDLDALKDQYTDRLVLIHLLSRERQDVDILNGRLGGDKLRELSVAGLIQPLDYDAIFCCGPHEMIEDARVALQGLQVPAERVHFELFTTADIVSGSAQKSSALDDNIDDMSGTEVVITVDGSEKSINVNAGQETILSAAVRHGMDLPFSCQGGMCCTCRCKILEGDVTMDLNFSLAQWEIDAGFVLACQARPMSEKVVLDFDAI